MCVFLNVCFKQDTQSCNYTLQALVLFFEFLRKMRLEPEIANSRVFVQVYFTASIHLDKPVFHSCKHLNQAPLSALAPLFFSADVEGCEHGWRKFHGHCYR